MSRLAPDRTNSPELLEIAGRIEAAQGDEIAFMEQWLTSRGESIDQSHAHTVHHTIKGMATEAQMASLAAAFSFPPLSTPRFTLDARGCVLRPAEVW